MIVRTTKSFDRQYKKLTKKTKKQFEVRIKLFMSNPFDSSLRNHALKGKYLGYRSVNISGDIRLLYTVKNDTVVILSFIGTHSQLYG